MPRRLNFTGRKKINREHALIQVQRIGDRLLFEADLKHLSDYVPRDIVPPPKVYVEAYRGSSTLWKRFDYGRVGAVQAPADRSLDIFSVPEGILFRVRITADGDSLGRLLAEADRIQPKMPDDKDERALPLIQHMAADDIGDELWRVQFSGDEMPLLKINKLVPMGVEQFLVDKQFRATFAPAVMRQVLTRILIIERYLGDDDDDADWRRRWMRFCDRLPRLGESPGSVEDAGPSLEDVENWIDTAVEIFSARSGLFSDFSQGDS